MSGKKILLVDDDRELLYGMKVWLISKGYRIFFAMDAASAVTMAQSEKPDVILLDIGLPGGDGYLAMARLRSLVNVAHIPIIVITARDPFVHQAKALRAGAEAFFPKPFDNHQLLAAIQKVLDGPTLGNVDRDSVKKKILIIDDDQDLLHGLRVRLQSSGFDVHLAADAVTSVSMAIKVKPDLILLDIGLPGGDGYLTMSRLKAILPLAHVPVFIMTAGDASVHREKALKAGADAFFPKPLDNQELLTAMRKALGEVEKQPTVPPSSSDQECNSNLTA